MMNPVLQIDQDPISLWIMARQDQITKSKKRVANNVSHSNRKQNVRRKSTCKQNVFLLKNKTEGSYVHRLVPFAASLNGHFSFR